MAQTQVHTTVVVEAAHVEPSSYVARAIVSLALSCAVFLIAYILTQSTCSGVFDCDKVLSISGIVSALAMAALLFFLVARPLLTRSDADDKDTKLAFNSKRAVVKRQIDSDAIEMEDDRERRRIQREYEEGLNKAAVREANTMVDTKAEVIKALAAGVINGTVDPARFATVQRMLSAGNKQVTGATMTRADDFTPATPTTVTNPEQYKIVSVGGADSPINGAEVRARYLTCSLKSLKAAVAIAEAGRQPTRSAFAKAGITANEETGDCQKFLRECGLMDTNSDWGKWNERLNVRNFSRWIALLSERIERGGGEELYRKAARIVTSRSGEVSTDGLTWQPANLIDDSGEWGSGARE